jgi:hypothetical protein
MHVFGADGVEQTTGQAMHGTRAPRTAPKPLPPMKSTPFDD